MQNYQRIYDYIYEFWEFLYQIYEKHAIAYLITYYNLNKEQTVWDDEYMMDGSYERYGELNGIKYNKFLTLPVYFIEETETTFDAQDIGYVDEGTIGFVIPDQYGIIPYPGDVIKLDQKGLCYNQADDTHTLFVVTGVKKQSPCDRTFWHCSCMADHSRKEPELTHQVYKTYTFFAYDKNVHTLEDSISLSKMMVKNETIKQRAVSMFDENSGFYFI